jgi:hypothetical protein
VMYAILNLHKPNETMNFVDIEDLLGVSTKTAKAAINRLIGLSYLEEIGNGFVITNYVKCLERWELGYTERIYNKMLLGKFTSIVANDFSDVRSTIEEYAMKGDVRIGGELAAAHLTPYLSPISTTLHIIGMSESRRLANQLKLKPDPNGNIAMFQIFVTDHFEVNTRNVSGVPLVSPLLIHAELVRTGDSRLKEAADIIYDKYIDKL